MNNKFSIPVDVVNYFGKALIDVDWQLLYFQDEIPPPISRIIDRIICKIPGKLVNERINNQSFQFLHEEKSVEEKQSIAKREILADEIKAQVNQLRINNLKNTEVVSRPLPYKHKSLRDLEIDKHGFVELSNFSTGNRNIERKNYVFELTPMLPASNSSYWLKKNLLKDHENISKKIRLDPLSIQHKSEYLGAEFKMFVYGVSLDWSQIISLKEELHGRWMPDYPFTDKSKFTDVSWSPRSDEIHFSCEEVPHRNHINFRGSRYLHAIFIPKRKSFVHLDGAIRYFSADEIDKRLGIHVRNSGKLGKRVKVFQLDGDISPLVWSTMVSSFFVWNYDVMNYVNNGENFPNKIENQDV